MSGKSIRKIAENVGRSMSMVETFLKDPENDGKMPEDNQDKERTNNLAVTENINTSQIRNNLHVQNILKTSEYVLDEQMLPNPELLPEDSDPLALQTESFLIIEYSADDDDKDEANNEGQLKNQPLRRSKRCKQNELQQTEDAGVETNKIQSESLNLEDNPTEVMPEPLFPITKRMRERIKRMKQRMLATLKLSDEQLAERRQRRAKQTRESRQRAASADVAYRRKETHKKIARTRTQRNMETPEQMAVRMAKKREEGRRYLAKRRQTETAEQKAARREYQRLYSENRKPIKFV